MYVADDRGQASLDDFYLGLSETQREGIESVCMDMWRPYISSTQKHVPDAGEKIAFDKFHVAKHLGEAVDRVRRSEHKAFLERGCADLKGTRYLWLRNAGNLSPQRWEDLKALRQRTLKTAEAWAVKEMVMSLWGYKTRGWARKAWEAVSSLGEADRSCSGGLCGANAGATSGRHLECVRVASDKRTG